MNFFVRKWKASFPSSEGKPKIQVSCLWELLNWSTRGLLLNTSNCVLNSENKAADCGLSLKLVIFDRFLPRVGEECLASNIYFSDLFLTMFRSSSFIKLLKKINYIFLAYHNISWSDIYPKKDQVYLAKVEKACSNIVAWYCYSLWRICHMINSGINR